MAPSNLATSALSALLIFSSAYPLPAQTYEDTGGIPTRSQVRSMYEASIDGHENYPATVLAAIVAAEDPDFWDTSPTQSIFADQLALIHFVRIAQGTTLNLARRHATSVVISAELSHAQILDWLLADLFFGRDCYGLPDAASAFFGVPFAQLSVGEAAFLAALMRRPGLLHRGNQHQLALDERNRVLRGMTEIGFLTEEEGERQIALPLPEISQHVSCNP